MTPVTIDPLYVAPAESEAACVITLSDLEDYLGEDLSASDSAPLAVEGACHLVRTVAEQHFNVVEDETIILDGHGGDALLLPERPVNEVSEVVMNDVEVTGYHLNDNGILLLRWPVVWRAGRQNISVTYSHGYAEMPGHIVAVALNVAKRLLYSASSAAAAASSGVEMEQLGAYTVRYGTSSSSSSSTSNGDDGLLTAGEKAILRRHKQSK